MSPVLLLAAISRCASLLSCPTDTELIDALLAHDTAVEQAIADDALRNGEIVLFRPQGVWRIDDVTCGESGPDKLPTVTCRFVARYTTIDVPQVAKLVQKNGNWRITETIPVERKQR